MKSYIVTCIKDDITYKVICHGNEGLINYLQNTDESEIVDIAITTAEISFYINYND